MKTIGYTLIGIVATIWLIALLYGMIAAFPFGLIGLMSFAGVGCLLLHVVSERRRNKEDDYYDKNIKQ